MISLYTLHRPPQRATVISGALDFRFDKFSTNTSVLLYLEYLLLSVHKVYTDVCKLLYLYTIQFLNVSHSEVLDFRDTHTHIHTCINLMQNYLNHPKAYPGCVPHITCDSEKRNPN